MNLNESIALTLVVGAFFLSTTLSSRQQDAFGGKAQEKLSPAEAGQRIAHYASERLHSCFQMLPAKEAALTQAIVAIEYVSVNPLEQVIEPAVVYASDFLGLAPPDFSLGPAQIKLATAQKARLIGFANTPLQAIDLIDDCRNIMIAHRLTRDLIDLRQFEEPLSKNEVAAIAKTYNGQLQVGPENLRYVAILQSLYEHYLSSPDINSTQVRDVFTSEH